MTKPCAEELTASSELADDALADAILQGLRKAGTWGLSKPLINVLLGRNLPVATVNIWPGCKPPAKLSASKYPRDQDTVDRGRYGTTPTASKGTSKLPNLFVVRTFVPVFLRPLYQKTLKIK